MTFAAFAIGRAFGGGIEQTMAFATLALAELGLVYGMRSPTAAAWQAPRIRRLNASVLSGVAALVVAAVDLLAVRLAFAAVPLWTAAEELFLVLAFVLLGAVELYKAWRRSRTLNAAAAPAFASRRLRSGAWPA